MDTQEKLDLVEIILDKSKLPALFVQNAIYHGTFETQVVWLHFFIKV